MSYDYTQRECRFKWFALRLPDLSTIRVYVVSTLGTRTPWVVKMSFTNRSDEKRTLVHRGVGSSNHVRIRRGSSRTHSPTSLGTSELCRSFCTYLWSPRCSVDRVSQNRRPFKSVLIRFGDQGPVYTFLPRGTSRSGSEERGVLFLFVITSDSKSKILLC